MLIKAKKIGKNTKKKPSEDKIKKVKVYEMDGIIFKNNDCLKYYKKLVDLRDKRIIDSFNVDSLSIGQKKSKYGANKIEINNHIFDSMLEGNYYLYLIQEKMDGRIEDFELKPSFILQESFVKKEKRYHQIKYIADFKVTMKNLEVLVIDTKGMVTSDFKLKQKMFEYKFPDLTLKLIKYVESYGGWIEYDDWMKEKNRRKKEKKKSEQPLN